MRCTQRYAYEMAYGRGMPMRCTHERYAYDIAPVRDTLMGWPMRDARLWDSFREKHAYERRAYEMATYERYTYEMAPVRSTFTRGAYGMAYERCTPTKCSSYHLASPNGLAPHSSDRHTAFISHRYAALIGIQLS
jgi:hypothetical protein